MAWLGIILIVMTLGFAVMFIGTALGGTFGELAEAIGIVIAGGSVIFLMLAIGLSLIFGTQAPVLPGHCYRVVEMRNAKTTSIDFVEIVCPS